MGIDKKVQVTIKFMTGYSTTLPFFLSDTIKEVRERLMALIGIKPERLTLLWAGKQLEDDQKLYSLGQVFRDLEDRCIHATVRFSGG